MRPDRFDEADGSGFAAKTPNSAASARRSASFSRGCSSKSARGGNSAAGAKTSCVAAAPRKPVVAAGFDDGTLWAANLRSGRLDKLKSETGAAICALAIAADGLQLAWGDETGGGGLLALAGL